MRIFRFLTVLVGFLFLTSDLHAGVLPNKQAQDSLPDVTVNVDIQPDVNLAKHKTYSWIPSPEIPIYDPKYYDIDLDAWVREAVDRELQSRGYKKQGYGEPAIWVTYTAAIDSDVKTQTVRVPVRVRNMGHPRAGMTMVDYKDVSFGDPIDRGTLVIRILSAFDMKKIWQASVAGEVRQNVDAQSRKDRLGKVVSKMMASVPLVSKKNDMDPIVERQEAERQVDARETMRDMRSR